MKILLGVLFLACILESSAETTDWARVHELTVRGVHQLYDLDVDSAMLSFDAVSRMAPGDPRGPFFQSMVHFYLYSLNRDEKELVSFFDGSERVIEVCDRLLDQNDQDAQTKFYLGGIYGYRGLAYQASGSIFKAAQDGRKGYMLLEEAVREKPDLYDAYMGFGLFQYLLAKIPKSMKWVLSVLGFEGNLEGGLNALKLAAQKGTYTRAEAKFFLSQFQFAEGRQDTALRYLNDLRKEYPENTLFLISYAGMQHRLNNFDEAMLAAREAIEVNNRKKVRYGEELAYSTLGSVYFTLNDFTNACTNYRLYMKMTRNAARTPNRTLYRAALACEIAGDREAAIELCRQMKEPDTQNRSWDMLNYRRGQDLLGHPLTEGEISVISGGNEASQKKYARAIQLYSEGLRKAGNNVDIQVRALYGIQQAQFDSGSLANAVETANEVLEKKPANETWIVPHAWFKLGQTFAKLGRTADARHAFEKVDDFDNYDFQERLETQVEEEMEKLQ